MAQHGGQLSAQAAGGERPVPGVHIRTADVGPRHLDQNFAGAHLRQADGFDLERSARGVEPGDTSFVHG